MVLKTLMWGGKTERSPVAFQQPLCNLGKCVCIIYLLLHKKLPQYLAVEETHLLSHSFCRPGTLQGLALSLGSGSLGGYRHRKSQLEENHFREHSHG